MCLFKSLLNMNVISHFGHLSWFWIVFCHVSLQFRSTCCFEVTKTAVQIFLELSWWEKSKVTINGFHNFHFHYVNRWYVFFQIMFSTFYHRDCIGTFVSDVSFQITCCAEDSRAIFTFEFVFITNTLRYGIFLHVISLWDSMCVFSFLPPLYVFSHFSQVSTRSSCFVSMCILRCLSEGASNLHMAQSCSTDNIFGCRILPKTNMQVLILDPKKLVDYGTLESEIRERCKWSPSGHQAFTNWSPSIDQVVTKWSPSS